MGKLLFFDIDGTLWDKENVIPDSTREAVKKLKEKGHKVFLCSGRTRAFIPEGELTEMGFDGKLCGCGTHFEYQCRDELYKTLDNELVARTVKRFYELGMAAVLEGKNNLYLDKEDMEKDSYGRFLIETMGDIIEPIRGNERNWEVSKYSVLIGGCDYQKILEEFKDDYEFLVHGDIVMEMVPKGFSKASGIKYVCDMLGASREDSFSFGDSANDIDMLKYAGVGIAMGNGTPEAKAAADYVTDDIHSDGIYNACRHFGLI